MNILLIDDTEHNLDAGRVRLTGQGHHVFTAQGYDEAMMVYLNNPDMMAETDAVLVDLMMPASVENLVGEHTKMAGQLMGVGVFLALLAAQRGPKYVALFTDSGHHSDPMSACIDHFASEGKPIPFMVGGAKVIFTNNPLWIDDNWDPSNRVKVKVWDKVLEYLVSC